MGPRLLALILGATAISGCGASTLRVEVAPTIDSGGRPGVESLLALGLGMPIDYGGRSHHFVQGLGFVGGGFDGRERAGELVTGAGIDYIHWAEPKMDIRAGARFAYRDIKGEARAFAMGGHFALMPMVMKDDSGWMALHLGLGPDLRIEYLWGDPRGENRTLFSLPLVLELNLLAVGD